MEFLGHFLSFKTQKPTKPTLKNTSFLTIFINYFKNIFNLRKRIITFGSNNLFSFFKTVKTVHHLQKAYT